MLNDIRTTLSARGLKLWTYLNEEGTFIVSPSKIVREISYMMQQLRVVTGHQPLHILHLELPLHPKVSSDKVISKVSYCAKGIHWTTYTMTIAVVMITGGQGRTPQRLRRSRLDTDIKAYICSSTWAKREYRGGGGP